MQAEAEALTVAPLAIDASPMKHPLRRASSRLSGPMGRPIRRLQEAR
jgi:hypothetical protein